MAAMELGGYPPPQQPGEAQFPYGYDQAPMRLGDDPTAAPFVPGGPAPYQDMAPQAPEFLPGTANAQPVMEFVPAGRQSFPVSDRGSFGDAPMDQDGPPPQAPADARHFKTRLCVYAGRAENLVVAVCARISLKVGCAEAAGPSSTRVGESL